MKNDFLKFFKYFFGTAKSQLPLKQRPKVRRIEDVKPGETIKVQWAKIRGGIGNVFVVNNSPSTKRMFIRIEWGNKQPIFLPQIEECVWDYSSYHLSNFALLNPLNKTTDESTTDGSDYDIITLQRKLNECLEKEEYEKADEYQNKINKLSRKSD